MSDATGQRTTLVLTDVRDADGAMYRAVSLTDDGGLTIEGHDVGRGVERIFGCREYEFERRLSADETNQLRGLLGVPIEGNLLAAVEGRFETTRELEAFVGGHGISGTFWSRMGD